MGRCPGSCVCACVVRVCVCMCAYVRECVFGVVYWLYNINRKNK